VLAGGDGMLGIGGIALRDTGLPLGIIPAGADNDLAHTLGIPHDPAVAAAIILGGHVREVNLGSVNGLPFFTAASVGLTVATARGLHRATGRSLARFRYLGAMLRVLLENRRFSAIIRCGAVVHRVRTMQITIGNGRVYGGGMQHGPAAEAAEDALGVYSLEPARRWDLLFLAPLFAGHVDAADATVRIMRSPVIEVVTRQPQPITADGEIVAVTPARFSVLAKAVKVYVPKTPADQPIATDEG
jgi:diacylglycerol kinase family enzyme